MFKSLDIVQTKLKLKFVILFSLADLSKFSIGLLFKNLYTVQVEVCLSLFIIYRLTGLGI